MALRVRGESLNEMLGALDALQPHMHAISIDKPGPVVVIPTYNGSRQIPNLVPLLACLLADEGISVLVHGVRHCPGRISTAEIFHAMGIETIEAGPGELSQAVNNSLARGDPAFVPVDVLSPALARLLARREQMGVRNTGHSLVKLVQPVVGLPALQLVSYTHAEFHELQQQVLMHLGANALQSRGCEGEAVAHPCRAMVHHWIHAEAMENLLRAKHSKRLRSRYCPPRRTWPQRPRGFRAFCLAPSRCPWPSPGKSRRSGGRSVTPLPPGAKRCRLDPGKTPKHPRTVLKGSLRPPVT